MVGNAELVFSSNIFGNLSIFIELFSIAKSASLVLISRGCMLSALHPHRWRAEDFRAPPSWRGVPRLAQRRGIDFPQMRGNARSLQKCAPILRYGACTPTQDEVLWPPARYGGMKEERRRGGPPWPPASDMSTRVVALHEDRHRGLSLRPLPGRLHTPRITKSEFFNSLLKRGVNPSFVDGKFPQGGSDSFPYGLSTTPPRSILLLVINRHGAHGRARPTPYLERQAREEELRVHHLFQVPQVLHVQHLALPADFMRPVALVAEGL